MEYMTRGISSLQDAINNKAHVKVGDAVANLIFSLAKAKIAVDSGGELDVHGTPKVSARILRDALAMARERSGVKVQVKGDAHAIADAAEAILSIAWVKRMLDIGECAGTIASVFLERRPQKTAGERGAFSEGFATILAGLLPVLARRLPGGNGLG